MPQRELIHENRTKRYRPIASTQRERTAMKTPRFVAEILNSDRFTFNHDEKEGDPMMYLTERLMEQMRKNEILYRQNESAYRIAKRCVDIYGIEAVIKFENDWNKLSDSAANGSE